MDPLNIGLDVGTILEGLPAAVGALKSLRKKEGERVRSLPGASEAYGAYQDAAGGLLFNLSFIAEVGVPPRLLGAAWTFPALQRSHRAFVEAAEQIVTAFGRMVLLGSEDALESGYKVAVALGDLVTSLPIVDRGTPRWMPIRWWPVSRQRLQADSDFRERVSGVGASIREFLLVARADVSMS